MGEKGRQALKEDPEIRMSEKRGRPQRWTHGKRRGRWRPTTADIGRRLVGDLSLDLEQQIIVNSFADDHVLTSNDGVGIVHLG